MNQPSIKKNFIMNALLTISSFIFPLITFPYISRVLSPEGIGKVSFANSVVAYFALFAQLGIPTYGVRACAKVRDNKKELSQTVQEIFIINIVMTIITYIVFGITLSCVSRLQADKHLLLIISSTMLFNAAGMDWFYRGLEKYTYITSRSILFKFIAIFLMFALVHQKSDYIAYGWICIFASSASNICNLVNIHRYIEIRPVGMYNFRHHLKPIIVFFAMSCATTIYTNLDTVMLGFIRTDMDVGYYNAAVKVKSVLLGVVTSLGTVLLPRASYYVEHHETNEFQRITRKAINFVILIAIPLTCYFILYAREGILFLSGNAYMPAVFPMQIIMPTILFIGLTNIMGIQMLVPLGREKIVLCSEIAGAIVDLIFNVLLIPRLASIGAAIGTLLAEIVVWIVQFTALRTEILLAYKSIQYPKILLATVAGIVSSGWVKMLDIGNFATLLISSILFFGIYCAILTVMREPLVCEVKNQMLAKIKSKIK